MRQFAPAVLNVLGVGPIVGAQVVVSWSHRLSKLDVSNQREALAMARHAGWP